MDVFVAIWDDVALSFEATPPIVAAVRMLIAAIFGAVIGYEREVHARTAGLRTHILISLGACLYALVTFEIIEAVQVDPEAQSGDPLRLIEAVTAGVAFLAAGSIIVSGGRIKGLTTGAGMWLAGAIGLCCGVGKIGLALLAVAFALVVLVLLRGVKEEIVKNVETSDETPSRPD